MKGECLNNFKTKSDNYGNLMTVDGGTEISSITLDFYHRYTLEIAHLFSCK